MIDLNRISGFDWDLANNRKSLDKQSVSRDEAESVFFKEPLIIAEDERHSQDERRMNALGQTNNHRLLHVTFTLRQDGALIRIISARDMNRKERTNYEHA